MINPFSFIGHLFIELWLSPLCPLVVGALCLAVGVFWGRWLESWG